MEKTSKLSIFNTSSEEMIIDEERFAFFTGYKKEQNGGKNESDNCKAFRK